MAIEKVVGIVTDFRKYSDRHNIVTLFAQSQGRVALLSPVGSGKSARLRNARLMPLSVVEADINFNPAREMQYLGSFSRRIVWNDLYFHPAKSAMAMFIAEFVNIYMRQSPPDELLWEYVLRSLERIDAARGKLGNYHLAFLVGFLHFAGIQPDLSGWREDARFDMRGGTMTMLPPPHRDVLSPAESRTLPLLARMNMRTAPLFQFSSRQRIDLLNKLLSYCALHFPGLSNLKSPQVLTEVFA